MSSQCYAEAGDLAKSQDSLDALVATAILDSTKTWDLVDQIKKNYQSNPERIRVLASGLIEAAKKNDQLRVVAATAYWLCILHDNAGNMDKATESGMVALRAAEQVNDTNIMANALIMLGRVNISRGINSDRTLNYFKKAEDCYKAIGSKRGVAVAMNWVGNVHYYREEFDEARTVYQNTLKASEEINYISGAAYCNQNLGYIADEKGDPELALQYHKQAMEQFSSLDDSTAIAYCHTSIGFAEVQLGQVSEAISSFTKAKSIANRMNNIMLFPRCYEGLSTAWSARGNFEKALYYLNLRNEIKDSLFTAESQQQIHDLEERYGAEKRRMEIKVLRQENVIGEIELAKKGAELSRQFAYTAALIIGMVLLGVLILVVVKNNRERAKVNEELRERNLIIEEQKQLVEEKNNDINASIRYARHIQEAILPTDKFRTGFLPKSFVLFKPRDIVSGDFYWIGNPMTNFKANLAVFAVADCTGHGVPGGFLSMVGHNYLHLGLSEKSVNDCADALDFLHRGLMTTLKKGQKDTVVADGMDIAMCSINQIEMKMEFAGARRPIYIIRDGELIEIKTDKFSIGEVTDRQEIKFKTVQMDAKKGDCIYLFSDGYPDQFGGPRNKKFSSRRLKELLLKISKKSMDEQKQILETTIVEWQDGYEQIDDICVFGVRIV